ncbi:uncharacterized protein METZ01_LOCUS391313, partial [marine metagenome]
VKVLLALHGSIRMIMSLQSPKTTYKSNNPRVERGFVVPPEYSFAPCMRHSLSNAERPLLESKKRNIGVG